MEAFPCVLSGKTVCPSCPKLLLLLLLQLLAAATVAGEHHAVKGLLLLFNAAVTFQALCRLLWR